MRCAGLPLRAVCQRRLVSTARNGRGRHWDMLTSDAGSWRWMGRKKIKIQPIAGDRNRSATFLKRKAGLFKKAYELAVLTDSEIAVIVFGRNGKLSEFCSGDIDQFLLRYTEYTGNAERRGPEDFVGEGSSSSAHDSRSEVEHGPERSAAAATLAKRMWLGNQKKHADVMGMQAQMGDTRVPNSGATRVAGGANTSAPPLLVPPVPAPAPMPRHSFPGAVPGVSAQEMMQMQPAAVGASVPPAPAGNVMLRVPDDFHGAGDAAQRAADGGREPGWHGLGVPIPQAGSSGVPTTAGTSSTAGTPMRTPSPHSFEQDTSGSHQTAEERIMPMNTAQMPAQASPAFPIGVSSPMPSMPALSPQSAGGAGEARADVTASTSGLASAAPLSNMLASPLHLSVPNQGMAYPSHAVPSTATTTGPTPGAGGSGSNAASPNRVHVSPIPHAQDTLHPQMASALGHSPDAQAQHMTFHEKMALASGEQPMGLMMNGVQAHVQAQPVSPISPASSYSTTFQPISGTHSPVHEGPPQLGMAPPNPSQQHP